MLIGVGTQASGVIQRAPIADANPGLVRLKLIRFQKTHIIGRHDRATAFRRQCHGGVEIVLLPRAPGALQFQIEAVGEAALPLRQGCAGIGLPAVQQCLADVALATT